MIKVMNWNVARRREPLRQLREMDADVALLQEVGPGMAIDLPDGIETGRRAHWDSRVWKSQWREDESRWWCDRWPMVVKMSDRVDVEWFEQVGPNSEPAENEIAVSGIGLIAAARVTPKDPNNGEPFIAVSMYAHWDPQTDTMYSARSIISDLSALTGRTDLSSHRILAAGDLNDWYGSGAYKDMQAREPVDTVLDRFGYAYRIYREKELFSVVVHRPNGDAFYIRRKVWKTLWGARNWIDKQILKWADLRRKITSGQTQIEPSVWDRMSALGLEFMGPQYPNGRQAVPVPDFMPSDTKSVVTFRRPGQALADVDQQLDYVFAPRGFHESITACALNSVEEWGASDHCRLLIEITG